MKDLGELKYFLEIEVASSEEGVFLSQRKYLLDLLKDTSILGSKPTTTPIDRDYRLTERKGDGTVEKEDIKG